jgi:hypothetical protein
MKWKHSGFTAYNDVWIKRDDEESRISLIEEINGECPTT